MRLNRSYIFVVLDDGLNVEIFEFLEIECFDGRVGIYRDD